MTTNELDRNKIRRLYIGKSKYKIRHSVNFMIAKLSFTESQIVDK